MELIALSSRKLYHRYECCCQPDTQAYWAACQDCCRDMGGDAVKITTQDGRNIPFNTLERGRALILTPRYFSGPDGGKQALEEMMWELYDKPNTPTADLYLLQQDMHIPVESLDAKLVAELKAVGALEHPSLGGVILRAQGVPEILRCAEDEGWIKTRIVPRYYHMGDASFVHIPDGPRISHRTPNPDRETASREIRCVTDKEQAIVDANPEYMKVEIAITEKTKRRYQREELTREIQAMPKIKIDNLTNFGNATFGDQSPIILQPAAIQSLESAVAERMTDNSFSQEAKNMILAELKDLARGEIKALSRKAIEKLIELTPILGESATQIILALAKSAGL